MSCVKCTGLGASFIPSINVGTSDNYCSTCGTSLRQTCLSCSGSGRKMFGDSYCSNCGSKLNTSCSSCNGSGYKSSIHMCIHRY